MENVIQIGGLWTMVGPQAPERAQTNKAEYAWAPEHAPTNEAEYAWEPEHAPTNEAEHAWAPEHAPTSGHVYKENCKSCIKF